MCNITAGLKVKTLLFLLGTISFLACTEQKQTNYKPLGYDEIFFDTELSSIWTDSIGDDLWVGGKNGEIFLVTDNNITWKQELKSGCIYKVAPLYLTAADTTLLVGIRNEGLQVWKFSKGQKERIKQFSISPKGFKYSAYDFQKIDGNAYYVGTSNGCYYVDFDATAPQLQLAYPTAEVLRDKYNYEYSVYNLQKRNDNTIVGASPQGVFWLSKQYNPLAKRDSIIVQAKNTIYVRVEGDSLFALAENKIYKHSNGHTYSPIVCKNNPQIYFQDNGGNKWLIASRSIRIGKQLEDNFEDIELPKSIPLRSQRNIIAEKKDFTYLVTQNSLWRIPVHLNIYNSPIVSAVCRNNQRIFFVTADNQLFEKTADDKAKYIKQIYTEGHIVWIAACNKYIYFHTGANMIYRTPIASTVFSSHDEKPLFPALQNPNNILTAYLYYEPNSGGKAQELFFGTRDGLFAVDLQDEKIQTLSVKTYVSALSYLKDDKHLVVTTLNDGITSTSVLRDLQSAKWSEKIPIKNIENKLIVDVAPISHYKRLILTNHAIFYNAGDDIDSLEAKAFRKILLVNDSVFFAVAYKGLMKYGIKNGKIEKKNTEPFYKDISFIPNACMVLGDNSLLLGSELGCLHYENKNSLNSKDRWIDFEPLDFIVWFKIKLTLLFVAIALLMLAVIVYLIFYIKKIKRSKKIKEKEIILEKNNTNLLQILEELGTLPESTYTLELLSEYQLVIQKKDLDEWEKYIARQENQLSKNRKAIERSIETKSVIKEKKIILEKNNTKLQQTLEHLETFPESSQTQDLILECQLVMEETNLDEWEKYISKQENQLNKNNRAIGRIGNETENKSYRQSNLQKRFMQAQKLIEDINYFPDNQEILEKLHEVMEKCSKKEYVAEKDVYYKTLTYVDDILMEVNSKTALLFQTELFAQINTIKAQKITILDAVIKQATDASNENNTSAIRKLTIENFRWFEKSRALEKRYDNMLQLLENCYEIPNVNQGLYNSLLRAKSCINNTEIEVCQKKCDELTEAFNGIEEATEQISLFIAQTITQLEKLQKEMDGNNLYSSIIVELKDLNIDKTTNIKVLQTLEDILKELPSIHSLCVIKKLADKFSTLANKHEREEMSKQINKEISQFYSELPEDIDDFITKEIKINGDTNAGKALALTLADRSIRGADVGKLIGDASPENFAATTSRTRKLIRKNEIQQKLLEFHKTNNDTSIIILLLIEFSETKK